MTTTHKSPNIAPSKFHVSVEIFHPSEKIVTHLGYFFAPISLPGTQKKSMRMHQEWPCVVCVAHGRGLRPYIGGAECLVCQLHCARLGKGFCGYIESVCSEGICRSWKNYFHSEIAELKPWRHFSWIDLYIQIALGYFLKPTFFLTLYICRTNNNM